LLLFLEKEESGSTKRHCERGEWLEVSRLSFCIFVSSFTFLAGLQKISLFSITSLFFGPWFTSSLS
jgi:hypothetical protein